MAYQTSTYTDASGLLASLSSFASSNGWTIDDAVGSNKFAMHKGDIWVSMRFDSPTHEIVSLHQALGHTVAADPGDHPDDSGSGYNSSSSVTEANLDGERYFEADMRPLGSTGTYHFFENDSSPAYLHVVLVRADLSCVHFGFGEVVKFGTWTGGEYCYGHVDSGISEPYSSSTTSLLLDGRFSVTNDANLNFSPTLHIEGFPDQDVAGKWGEVGAGLESSQGTDTAGELRYKIQGGYRGGPLMRFFGQFPTNRSSGYINTIPISLFGCHLGSTPNRIRRLGEQPDVRGIVLEGIATGEQITIGSETWVCFPSVKKGETTDLGVTLYQGVAYRLEVA